MFINFLSPTLGGYIRFIFQGLQQTHIFIGGLTLPLDKVKKINAVNRIRVVAVNNNLLFSFNYDNNI